MPVCLPLGRAQLWIAVLAICGITLVAAMLMALLKNKSIRSSLMVIIAAGCGFSINGYQIIGISHGQLAEALEGRDLAAEIVVDSLVQYRSLSATRSSASFYAQVKNADDDSLRAKRVRLSWYQPPGSSVLKPGSRWALTLRLKQPRGTVNPGGFDYQAWLLAQGVVATGYVRDREGFTLLGEERQGFDHYRQQLSQSLFKQRPSDPLLKALLIGDKSDISQHQWQVLQKTGTVHLMAISGLHIGLIATFGFFLGRLVAHLLSLLRPKGLLWLAPLCAILCALVYAGLAGFAIPTQRALVMVVLFSLALAQGRRVNYWHVYMWALCLVLILDPFAPLSSGFWLSFAAVAVLVFSFSGRPAGRSVLAGLIRAQWYLLIGLAVPLSLLGLPVSALAPFANIIAVPVVSVAIVPLLLLSAAISGFFEPLALQLMNVADGLFSYLWLLLEWLSGIDLRWRVQPAQSVWMVFVGVLAVVFSLSPVGLRLRLCGVALLLVFFFPVREQPTRLTVIDVQQGLSVVAQSAGQTLVYDAGSRFGDFDMGTRIVAPYLFQQGVSKLNTLLISHGDNVHAGGFYGLADLLPPERTLSGEPERLKGIPEPCVAGQQWLVGAFEVSVLWPGPTSKPAKPNNRSCVLLLQLGELKVLIPGDIEQSVEAKLLQAAGMPPDIDVLLVPHHGSKTSSSRAFVSHLKPRYAVFSAGYKNRYHHPNKRVVQLYRQHGSETLHTAQHGAIEFVWDASGQLNVTKQRQSAPRPWHNFANWGALSGMISRDKNYQ